MEKIGENIWLLRYPLQLMGMEIGRNVTVLKLQNSKVIVHSSAPFSPADIQKIEALGSMEALVEATLFHDTCAKEGITAFPKATYYAPAGFGKLAGKNPVALETAGNPWAPELEILKIDGMPKVNEHLFLHHPSKTLIFADLLFNWGPGITSWEKFLRRYAVGIKAYPGMGRLYKMLIRDKTAFSHSIQKLLTWNFQRIIFAHGPHLEFKTPDEARAALKNSLSQACPFAFR